MFVVSSLQSSRELLQLFSRKYLAGEGDIARHLSLIGYSATHTQVRHENTEHNNQLDIGYTSPSTGICYQQCYKYIFQWNDEKIDCL